LGGERRCTRAAGDRHEEDRQNPKDAAHPGVPAMHRWIGIRRYGPHAVKACNLVAVVTIKVKKW
jgi:hypothetical protein